jgi:glyoxylase-like metal-dependent hydrolase (beta-lactamase superfamily II)
MSDGAVDVSTRRFGGTEVSVIRTAVLHWAPSFPAGQPWQGAEVATDGRGRAVVDVLCVLIRTPGATILVDPGAWHADERSRDLDVIAGAPVDETIASLGVAATDVTHVAITHAHTDHLTGLARAGARGPEPRFPRALHLFPRADREALDGDAEASGRVRALLAPVEDAGLLSLVASEHPIDRGVTLSPAPGETAGHQIVRVEDGGERVLYLGDLFHFPIEFEHIDWAPVHADAAVLRRSRRRVLDDAEGATLVFSHGRFPGWGRADRSGPAWPWHYQ